MATTDAPARGRPASTSVVPRRVLAGAVLVVGAIVAIVRWRISHHLTVYALIPDEAAQLAMARTLAGDRWSMLDYSTFRPGFSVLISPIWWFTDDPVTGLRWVWAVNAVLGGLTAGLYVIAARRLTNLGIVGASLAALAVALAPALLFTSRFAWAEALVQPVVVAFVLAVVAFGRRPGVRRGMTAVVLAAAGFTVHSRLLPLALVALGLTAYLVMRRELTRRDGAIIGAVGFAALVVSEALARWVVHVVWTDPYTTNSFGGAIGQWRQVGSMFATALGHVWYQLVATCGLVALGAWALLRPGPGDRASRRDGVLVTVSVVLLMLLSVAFLAGRARPDRIVYGRYTDPAAALLVMAGLGAVMRHRRSSVRRLAVIGAGTVGVTLALVGLRGDELRATGVLRAMVLGLQPVMGLGRVIPITRLTVVAVTGMVVWALAASLPRAARATLLVVAVAGSLFVADRRVHDMLDRGANARMDASDVTGLVAGATPILPAGAALRSRVVETGVEVGREGQRQRVQLYQYFLPGHRVDLDGEEPGPTPYVIAPTDDPLLGSDPDAQLLWAEPGTPIGLWLVPVG
ncbi:MAG: hypothetical protein ACK5OX_05140 [Desertimonas sp.]